MKFSVRKAVWVSALAGTIILFGTPNVAFAYPGQDQNQNSYNPNDSLYQQGLSNGQEDGANNRSHQYRLHPDNDADRHAYESGYDQGYQNNSRSGTNRGQDRDANGNYNGQNGRYGQYGPYGNVATQNGFQDGANDGLKDRQSGHSFRPTEHESWEHGDRGYNSGFGSKNQYKGSYRQAYIQGYQQGYNGQGSDNRR